MKKIAFKTLGCRLNHYETDALVSEFFNGGYEIVDFHQKADVYIINTCTVTNQSDRKSMQFIRHVNRKYPDSLLVVTGCMVNNFKEELQNSQQNPACFVENAQKSSIFPLVESFFRMGIIHPEIFENDLFDFKPASKTLHTRSFIKIHDGCNNFCSYCIIPKVRGRAISRPVQDVLENIRQVLDFGFKEIILTGVNIGRYNYENTNFENLVEKILDIPGDFRFRISSIEPEGFGDKLFVMFENPKLAPHLHLCLQSGSEEILKKMHRMYTLEEFKSMFYKIKNRYPDFNLTTDIIVGFPGETEENFHQTVNVVREIDFGHIHTFKYSVRNGTRAARMSDQISGKIKTERSKIIRNISQESKGKYRLSMIGKNQTVLVEKVINGFAHGFGEHYIPVRFKTENSAVNIFKKVKLDSLTDDPEFILIGKIIKKTS